MKSFGLRVGQEEEEENGAWLDRRAGSVNCMTEEKDQVGEEWGFDEVKRGSWGRKKQQWSPALG